MDRILIYRLGSLGDTVMALPTLTRIRQRFPQAQITLLTNFPVAAKAAPMMEILAGTGIVDGVISYPLGTRDWRTLAALRRTLRAAKFDLLIHLGAARGLGNSVRDALFFRWCGISRITGIPWRRADLSCQPVAAGGERYEWEAARLARRGEIAGSIDLGDESLWDLKLTGEEIQAAAACLRAGAITGPFIAASVGTKVSANHWTVENWRRLFALLGPQAGGYSLVAVGAPDEHSEAEFCLSAWTGPKLNLCGQTSPRQAAALLQKASLYLGHDSGLLHLAALVGTPCVGIYSARNPPGQWFPKGTRHTIFYRQVECFGCLLTQCIANAKKCILGVPPAEVAAAALRQLEGCDPTAQTGKASGC